MTLVEVVASLALLGGVITTLVLAQARAVAQLAAARVRHQAAVHAEQLVQEWQVTGVDLTVAAEGLADPEGWSWQRRVNAYADVPGPALVQVHLTIFRAASGGLPQSVAEYDWLVPRDVATP